MTPNNQGYLIYSSQYLEEYSVDSIPIEDEIFLTRLIAAKPGPILVKNFPA